MLVVVFVGISEKIEFFVYYCFNLFWEIVYKVFFILMK